jgi:hypothetical protein
MVKVVAGIGIWYLVFSIWLSLTLSPPFSGYAGYMLAFAAGCLHKFVEVLENPLQ